MDSYFSPVDFDFVFLKYEAPFFEIEDDEIDSVHLTSEGLLEEKYENRVVSSCALPIDFFTISPVLVSIKVFYIYEPYAKYYAVLADEQLFIIKRLELGMLELISTFNDVNNFSIDDTNDMGRPQIKIHLSNNEIVNFVDETLLDPWVDDPTDPEKDGEGFKELNDKAQELDVSLRKATNRWQDLIRLVLIAASRFRVSPRNEVLHTVCPDYELSKVLGILENPVKFVRGSPISHRDPWVRVVPGAIILGVFVTNLVRRGVKWMQLTVDTTDTSLMVDKSLVFSIMEPFAFDGVVETVQDNSFGPHGYAHLIGICHEPIITDDILTFPLIITFMIEGDETYAQLPIGLIDVFYHDLLINTYSPFNGHKEVSDLLALLALCNKFDISGEPMCDFGSTVLGLGFEEIGNFYVKGYGSTSAFNGMVIQIISEETKIIRIYYRKVQDLYFLAISLNRKVSIIDNYVIYYARGRLLKSSLCSELRELYKIFEKASIKEFEQQVSVKEELLTRIFDLENETCLGHFDFLKTQLF